MFADIYGTLCCGSGFAQRADGAAGRHPREVTGEVRGPADWGSYPARTLRVLLTVAALTELGVQPPTSRWPTPGSRRIPTAARRNTSPTSARSPRLCSRAPTRHLVTNA